MRTRRFSLGVTLLTVALAVPACVGMVRVKHPDDYFATAHPKLIRVTEAGKQFVMVGAHVESDTLMGFVQDASGIHTFTEVPLTSISKLEAEQRSTKKTALAIGAATVGVGAAWFALYSQAQHQGTSQFCRDGLYGAGVPCD